MRGVARRLAELGVEAVAVALIHAYANPAHEARTAESSPMSAAHQRDAVGEACPEAREYERTSTAIANAYVRPLMSGYLLRPEREMRKPGYSEPIHLMTPGGSFASLETAARFPLRPVDSAPARGATLAGRFALARGDRRILSFYIGGTTAKICLIDDGAPLKARVFEVDRQSRFKKGSGTPVRIPIIEMVEIGAGGGSIARVDALQRILVGPDSAGAEPGPACYGRGGDEPTVTDADLVIGKIVAARFAGGKIPVDAAKAEGALAAGVGAKLTGMAVEQAAIAVAEIVDENMANAARVHAVERGVAIAERTLVAFGGAAPLHASRLAEKLGIARIIVPPDAGVGSASASWRRRPPTDRALATCASMPSTPRPRMRWSGPCSGKPYLMPAAAGERPCWCGARPSALRRRATRSRLRCPTAPWWRPTPPPSARSSSAVCVSSPASSPRPDRIMSWLVLATTRRTARPARGPPRTFAGAHRRAQRVRYPPRPAPRRVCLRAPPPGPGRHAARPP